MDPKMSKVPLRFSCGNNSEIFHKKNPSWVCTGFDTFGKLGWFTGAMSHQSQQSNQFNGKFLIAFMLKFLKITYFHQVLFRPLKEPESYPYCISL